MQRSIILTKAFTTIIATRNFFFAKNNHSFMSNLLRFCFFFRLNYCIASNIIFLCTGDESVCRISVRNIDANITNSIHTRQRKTK